MEVHLDWLRIRMLIAIAILLTATVSTGESVAFAGGGAAKPGALVPIYASFIDEGTSVTAGAVGVQQGSSVFAAGANGANITVNYTGFSVEAQAAFEYAVNIWEAILVSDVDIVVDAYWMPLGPNVLGAAGATDYFRNFPGAPYSDTWYPAALANKLAGTDQDVGLSDIETYFSSSWSWYLGTDGNTPSGQHDFVTVVLHEIGHGLGFSGSMSGDGSWGVSGDPRIYDVFAEDGVNQSLLNTAVYPNPSSQLLSAITTGQVFFDGPATAAANGGSPPELYTPSSWSSGSSYSHLDEASYPAGHLESLMTPNLGMSEAIHTPGPVTKAILQDLGWSIDNPSVSATELRFTQEPGGGAEGETLNIQPIVALTDGTGAVDTNDPTTVVTLSLIGSGTLTCDGGLSKTVTSSVATFSGCSIDTAGSVQIHAESSPALTPTDTASFLITSAGQKLAFTNEPGNAMVGAAFDAQPAVAVQDGSGVTQTSDNTTVVTLSLIGSGTLTCADGLSKTVTSGVATFSGCSIDTAGSVQIHAVSSPASAPADTASFEVTNTKLAFTGESAGTTVGVAFAIEPAVAVQDGGSAIVTSDNSTVVTLSLIGPGTLTCDGGLSKTVTSGVATFQDCTIDTAGGGLQLHASATAIADATSSSFSNVPPPAGGLWYLAEGFTGFGWTAELHILNPGGLAANVAVTYLLDGGSPVVRHFTVNAQSHLTVNANDPAQGPGPDAAFGVRVASDRAIMVEEDMYTGDSGDFAHGTQATDTLSTTWYFAEGFTQFGWQTFVLVAVPGTAAADVTITYTVQGGASVANTVNIQGERRATFVGHTDVPDATFSVSITSTQPVVAEMVMLDPGRLIAHRTIGVSAASTIWYLGEGFTGFGWETFISVGNPGNSEATVTATYNIDGEDPVAKQIVVPAGSRGTFIAHDTDSGVGPGKAFGLVITSDQQVVVQEVLIDPAGGASRAHSTMASSQLANMWTFSGGSTETGMSTFLTVANPSASNSTVTATYYFHDGSASIFENMVVSAGRRGTFASSASITAGRTFGVIITAAGGNIVAQQVVYDEVRGRAFSSSGSWGP